MSIMHSSVLILVLITIRFCNFKAAAITYIMECQINVSMNAKEHSTYFQCVSYISLKFWGWKFFLFQKPQYFYKRSLLQSLTYSLISDHLTCNHLCLLINSFFDDFNFHYYRRVPCIFQAHLKMSITCILKYLFIALLTIVRT